MSATIHTESDNKHTLRVVNDDSQTLDSVVIRFSGDSGDGMQLTGTQFTNTSAVIGNDISTFPDYPAEIRAPAGTTFGVSGFQINFSSKSIFTPGDAPDVLVAMNPAALAVNLKDLKKGGVLIVNKDAFTKNNLAKAGYTENPLDNDSLSHYRLFSIDITEQTTKALAETTLTFKEVQRAKNFWTLGLLYYLYNRPLENTLKFINEKFARKEEIAKGNRLALKGGFLYGEVSEIFQETYQVEAANLEPGKYRNITGNTALAWGAIAASDSAGVELFLGSYPITPASDILHELSKYKHFGVTTFQAEDEIAAVCAAIGASYAGKCAMTTTSGPGVALKAEAIGLAVSMELPLVVVNVQRGGPSTGLPTKTEQSDLLQCMFGRNGDCPTPVVAAATPADCFEATVEAFRMATKYMVPVFLMTDGYLANGSEPWKLPAREEIPTVEIKYHTETEEFHPYKRDEETLGRVWAIPGTPGLQHRVGGIEKDYNSGNISYDPANHERMVRVRQAKVDGIANDIPDAVPFGSEDGGKLLVIGWGSTFGSIRQAVKIAREDQKDVSHLHLRHINPFPKNLEEVISKFDKVVVPEMNMGQLLVLLRSKFGNQIEGYNKIQGQPFKVTEILSKIEEMIG